MDVFPPFNEWLNQQRMKAQLLLVLVFALFIGANLQAQERGLFKKNPKIKSNKTETETETETETGTETERERDRERERQRERAEE